MMSSEVAPVPGPIRAEEGGAVDLSIIIVNYNTADDLRNCLKSILPGKTHLGLEILVVDNASQDASVDMLRHEFPEIPVLSNDQNLGFPAANNQAIRLARGRHILLLNRTPS